MCAGNNLRLVISFETSPAIKSRCVEASTPSLLEFSVKTSEFVLFNSPKMLSSVVFD